ncbi:hypothetical protein NBE98_07500 [Clostridium swellfunianum]|uniref:hypothetical protein n=1 Tax=Clostridium swellfunianum TaxID=1367462 RepID=UPI00202F4CA7|nr:hypothetical protein [Clostridium swellfunianum]MCM0648219.1 hypothetical protein [Clostridium swellfunianum]
MVNLIKYGLREVKALHIIEVIVYILVVASASGMGIFSTAAVSFILFNIIVFTNLMVNVNSMEATLAFKRGALINTTPLNITRILGSKVIEMLVIQTVTFVALVLINSIFYRVSSQNALIGQLTWFYVMMYVVFLFIYSLIIMVFLLAMRIKAVSRNSFIQAIGGFTSTIIIMSLLAKIASLITGESLYIDIKVSVQEGFRLSTAWGAVVLFSVLTIIAIIILIINLGKYFDKKLDIT